MKKLRRSTSLIMAIVLMLTNISPAMAVDFSLSVNKDDTGIGTVTSDPYGIDCGLICDYAFAEGSEVTLTAMATTGSFFAGWSGEGCSGTGLCTVTMDKAKSLTATFTEDTTAPTITNVTSSTANGSYTTGAVIPVEITFSEVVNISGGIPLLTLETGTTNRTAAYASGTGTNILTFTYTVQAGDTSSDLDYVATNSLVPGGATIRDAALNDASLTLPAPGGAGSLGGNKAIVIDTTAPIITINNPTTTPAQSKTITASTSDGSLSMSNTTGSTCDGGLSFEAYASQTFSSESDNGIKVCYKATDTVGNTAYSLSNAIAGIDTSAPIITINNPTTTPAQSKTITASTSDGSLSMSNTTGSTCDGGLSFEAYASQTFSSESDNGIKVCYKATDTVGNTAYSLSNAIAGIDTTVPTISNVTSSTANGSYTTGAVIPVEITFSEAVNISGGIPLLTLETGTTNRTAAYASGTGTNILTFTYTVQAGDTSSDLDYVATNSLVPGGATIRDAALNNASLTLPAPGGASSLGGNKAIVIDTTAPIITINNPTTTPAQSKTITASTSDGSLSMSNTTGSTCDGGLTFEAYASQTFSSESDNGIKVCYKATDTVGNTAYSLSNAIAGIDTSAPIITINNPTTTPAQSKTITASTSDGSLSMSNTTGSTCDGGLSFEAYASQTFSSESDNGIKVCYKATDTVGNTAYSLSNAIAGIDTSAPIITINNPTTTPAQSKTITASTSDGSLSMSNTTGSTCDGGLSFETYASRTFSSESDNGIKVCYKATDTVGNTAYSLSNAIAGIDTTVPTISNVTSSTANGSYSTGAVIPVEITFSEVVNISGGIPLLTLETGTTNRTAAYASGTGTNILTFTYTVQAGDTSSDLDYVATNSLVPGGATIRDAALNNASLTLPAPGGAGSLGGNKAIVIDTTAPIITINNPTTDPGAEQDHHRQHIGWQPEHEQYHRLNL